MDDDERVELEADIEKIHHTLESDKSQWQFGDDYDSDDDSDEEVLYIDLDKHGSATVSLASASASAHSEGGRTTPSVQSVTSHPATESVATERDEDAEQIFREVGVVLDKIDDSSSLPASLESCLVINRAYQDIIMEHISRLELALAENREAQKKLEEDAKETTRHMMTKRRYPSTLGAPYFKGSDGSCPQPNEDVRLKQATQEPDMDARPEQKWTSRQNRLLLEAVKEDSLKKLLQPLLTRRELEEEKLQREPENSEEAKAIKNKIKEIDDQIAAKQTTSDELLLRDVDVERVDWMKISNLTFQGRRDYMSCKRAWMHYTDPKLNMAPMTDKEAIRLQQLVAETKGHNWVYIAQQLGTGRTAFQCLQYYQQNLNQEKLQRPWTEEEDKQLISVVEKCQQYHFNWHKVSQYIEGRSSMQCYRRFTKLDPNKSSGHWTEEEDAQLLAAIQLVGTRNWGKVQELVPGRTREQCRERYSNSLDPSISGKRWTYEDDRQMLKGVEKYGKGQWVKICREFCPGRTDNQVLQRFRRLEDWKRKSEWFASQPQNTQRMLQGSELPADRREEVQKRNWEQYQELFNVLPCDYEQQQRDKEKGLTPVPRPPFLLGLASRKCHKVWESRMKLHQLIEEHVEKMRERFESMDVGTTVSMYDLQEALSNLSQEVLSRHKETLSEVLGTRTPSSISVGDMLAITRGNVEKVFRPRAVRGPRKEKHTPKVVDRSKLFRVQKVDTELKRLVRSQLKCPGMKKGRPRRFFWDVKVDQGMSDHDLNMLRATAMNLYFKSLGAEPGRLLARAQQQFPEISAQLQEQDRQREDQNSDSEAEERDIKPQLESLEPGQALRRSNRARKPARDDRMLGMEAKPITEETPEDSEMLQKRKDFEKLHWMCRILNIPPEYPPPEDISGEVEVGGGAIGMEVSQAQGQGSDVSEGRPRFTGMQQVHQIIEQAERESLAQNTSSTTTPVNADSNNATLITTVASPQSGDATAVIKVETDDTATGENVHPMDCTSAIAIPQSGIADTEPISEAHPVSEGGREIIGTNTEDACPLIMGVSSDARPQDGATPSTSCSGISVSQATSQSQSVSSIASSGTAGDSGIASDGIAGDGSIAGALSAAANLERRFGFPGHPSASTSTSPSQQTEESNVKPTSSQIGQYSYAVPIGEQAYKVFPNQQVAPVSLAGTGRPPKDTCTTIDLELTNDRPKFPNQPPTKTSLQSFRLLLLKRLDLIRQAGPYYNAAFYQAKKGAQLETLSHAGKYMNTVNKGSMDLSRLMNKVSQQALTEPLLKGRKRRTMKSGKSKDLNPYTVMANVRKTEAYKKLASRFEALYLWPGFLSALYPPFQRHNFTEKALNAEKPKRDSDLEELSEVAFKHLKHKPAMLKTKRFYKFANKSKVEKRDILRRHKQKRILKQVQELMADDDDPKPEVLLHSDSDAEDSNMATTFASSATNTSTDPQPSTSTAGGVEEGEGEPVQKRRKRTPRPLAPSRQSERQLKRGEKRCYSDKAPYRKRGTGIRRGVPRVVPVRCHRSKHTRNKMIEAMVQMKKQQEEGRRMRHTYMDGLEGYVSDEVDSHEVERTEDEWVWELPEQQKDSLIHLEKETAIVVPDSSQNTGGMNASQTATPSTSTAN